MIWFYKSSPKSLILKIFGLVSCLQQYRHKFPASPHTLFLTNTRQQKPFKHTHTHLQFKLRERHHSKGGVFVMFCSTEGLPSPLWSTIRELCCTQIELSERLPFNPPFHTKRTPTHCRQPSRVTLTHTQNGDDHRANVKAVWECTCLK